MNLLYWLFAITIFLSSFLLFQVQPLIGKHILPWFGGSAEVWVTAMLFFMSALAVGYGYALLLSKARLWYQVIVHIVVIIVTVIFVKTHAEVWSSAITPALDSLALDFSSPAIAVLKTLIITIGLPFALLSSSSTLLQMWYERLSGREPFSLYGVSNVGSLLGLLSYPVFFERFLSTYVQGAWWTYGLLAYVGLLLIILYVLLIFTKKVVERTEIKKGNSPTKRQFLVWTGVTAVPVMVMLSGTIFMTTSIMAVPFLWVGPLALYLLSFVVTFQNGFRTPVWVNEVFVIFAVSASLFMVILTPVNVAVSILLVHLALFSIYHWCHEYLYASRPDAKYLAVFYVALSLGGIVGSLLIKLANSYLLTIPIELMVLFVISVGVIAWNWRHKKDYYLPISKASQLRLLSVVLVGTLVLGGASYIHLMLDNKINHERNFFGYKSVASIFKEDEGRVALVHGTTNHGFQIIKDTEPQIIPTSYYSETAGVGLALAYLREQKPEGLKVGIAGLGTGTLSAYCLPTDEFTYFEIDPQVVEIAQKDFTFLDHCPQTKIVVTDGRLGFAKVSAENPATKYDLIIIDSYADDSVPIHLMTTEAVALYKSLLSDKGVLAIHVSSRYLDLLPVVKALAKANNLPARYINDEEPASEYATASVWTLLVLDEVVFSNEAFARTVTFADIEKEVLWTDTFSALLPVVRF